MAKFEEPKKMVKYYPALVKSKNGILKVSLDKFHCFDEAKLFHYRFENNSLKALRLITEIPELIEEREE